MSETEGNEPEELSATEEADEWTQNATAEQLAASLHARWQRIPGSTTASVLEYAERSKAFLQLRLTTQLVEAIDRLVAASNGSTATIGRLTAVYVGLTGFIAMAALIGLAFPLASVFAQYRQEVFGVCAVAGVALASAAAVLAHRLWPRGGR